jgi:triosephosphate isomerase (TIM)
MQDVSSNKEIMMQSKPIIIANWKLFFSFQQTVEMVKQYKHIIEQMSEDVELIIAPEISALFSIASLFQERKLLFSGQDCSVHEAGAFTGEISARSLNEAGARFCLAGHVERRKYHHETISQTARKVAQITKHDMIPIVCIGSLGKIPNQELQAVVREQLLPVVTELSLHNPRALYFAFEPGSAVGSGAPANLSEIKLVANLLKELIPYPYRFLYGGSVDQESISHLWDETIIDGFLLGRSAANFQNLQNIVSFIKRK